MDCVIEDHTGHTKIQLWDDMIEKFKNSSSYDITDLSIKNYNGHKHLGSTYDNNQRNQHACCQPSKTTAGYQYPENSNNTGIHLYSFFMTC